MVEVLLAPTVTKLAAEHAGQVLVCGSHGAVFSAYRAALGGVRGIILSDGGVGKDEAGIGGLKYLDALAIPGATVDCWTGRIGDPGDMAENGLINHANGAASELGVVIGQLCEEAAEAMTAATLSDEGSPTVDEVRTVLAEVGGGLRVVGMDSATLVRPEDAGQIVIAGSHGGLMGGDPRSAITEDVLAVTFSDAGIGKDEAGLARLAVLDERGISSAAVSVASARIGDGCSHWETGTLSRVNATAAAVGAQPEMTAQVFAELIGANRETLEKGIKTLP